LSLVSFFGGKFAAAPFWDFCKNIGQKQTLVAATALMMRARPVLRREK
jgi:hypothetical protein